jgi:hypothetical protein
MVQSNSTLTIVLLGMINSWGTSTYSYILPFLPASALDVLKILRGVMFARRKITRIDFRVNLHAGVCRDHVWI